MCEDAGECQDEARKDQGQLVLATGAVGGGTVGGGWQCPFGGPEGGSCSQQLYVEESCPPTPTSPRCFHIFLMFITTFEGCHEIWDPKTHRAVEVYMSFWAEDQDFKGKVCSSQVNNTWETNSCWWPRAVWHRGESREQILFLSVTLNLYRLR